MPFPLLAAAAAIPAVFQGIQGLKQARQASRMNPVRPTYRIPGAVNTMLETAQQSANAAMPGFGQAQANLQAGTANAVRSAQLAGSGNNALATIAAAQANEADGMNSLAANSAQFRFGQRQNLQQALMQKAGFQDKAWDYNERQKFDEEAAAKAALTESGLQNQNNGLGGLSSVAIAGAGGGGGYGMVPGMQGPFPTYYPQQPIGNRTYNDAANYDRQPYSSMG